MRPDEIRVLTSEPAAFVIQLLFFTVICNFIPDYFSLLETRFIIKQMQKTQSVFQHVLWLAMDFFVTVVITVLLPFIYLIFITDTPFWASSESITIWIYIKEVVTLSGYVFYNYSPIPYYSIIFFTSFFTSIWIWLYILSGLIIRLFSGWRFLKTTVELDEKPVSYLGFTTILLLSILCTVVWLIPEREKGIRHEPRVFDAGDAARMIRAVNFFDIKWNPGSRGFANRFVLCKNGKTVFDSTTGLTWQQSGSLDWLNYKQAHEYLDSLNEENYAGFSDWRMPTLEESLTLMDPENRNGWHIDPIFDTKQWWLWTSDRTTASRPWYVNIIYGACNFDDLDLSYYLRAVR